MNTRRQAPIGFFAACVVLTLSAGLLAVPAIDKPTPKDILKGAWRAVLSETQALVLDFENDRIELKLDNDGQISTLQHGKLSFPKERAEQHMDWTELKGGESALPDNHCLYRVAGDVLLLIGGGANLRPTKFYTGPGSEPRTLVFTKVPEAAKPAK